MTTITDGKTSDDNREANAAADAVFGDEDFIAEVGSSNSRSARLAMLLGFAALFLAVVAVLGFFYLAASDRSSPNSSSSDGASAADLAALSASLTEAEASILAISTTLTVLSNADGATVAGTTALEQRLDARLRIVETVPARVARLERSFSTLQGISTGVQDTWLLAETEYYMQIANAQLQLAANPHLATLALKLADERLLQLGDPALTDVRRALARELRSLEAIENPDIEGATLMLASLAEAVDSLSLRQEAQPEQATTELPADDAASGIDRAVASFKGMVSDMITIRRTDEAVQPLIAPEAVYFLRANLALQLQTASLALLRNEQAVFQQSLDDAAVWLEKYYDLSSAPVRQALQTLREIRDSSFVSALPDISASLSLQRQHVAFGAAGDALDVVDAADTADTPDTTPEPQSQP